jgi:hypothetical protein
MAGDWFQIDDDLPEKPEVQTICDRSATPIDAVLGRLVLLWRWADRHADNGLLRGVSLQSCARMFGGEEKFWKVVSEVGWLSVTEDGLRIPRFAKRFSKSAKTRLLAARRQANKRVRDKTRKRDGSATSELPTEQNRTEQSESESEKNQRRSSDLTDSSSDPSAHGQSERNQNTGQRASAPETNLTDRGSKDSGTKKTKKLDTSNGKPWTAKTDDIDAATPLARDLFRRIGYSGDDGAILWKVAILVDHGPISSSQAISAAQGAKLGSKGRPVGYFRKTLKESVPALDTLLAYVNMPRGFSCGPPSGERSFKEVLREAVG